MMFHVGLSLFFFLDVALAFRLWGAPGRVISLLCYIRFYPFTFFLFMIIPLLHSEHYLGASCACITVCFACPVTPLVPAGADLGSAPGPHSSC